MSNPTPFDFGKFVPGFDFLQSLAQGASGSMAQLPKLSNWVAPTISVEELDKRIQELKTVQFWLEQNARALAATMQALEVQKMTLATLKGMNFSIGDVANVFKSGTTGRASAAHQATTDAPPATPPTSPAPTKAQEPAPDATAQTVVDPLQWWGALTSQFQQIAANALKDAAQVSLPTPPNSPPATAGRRKPAAAAGKAAKGKPAAAPAVKPSAGRKPPARSSAARRPAG